MSIDLRPPTGCLCYIQPLWLPWIWSELSIIYRSFGQVNKTKAIFTGLVHGKWAWFQTLKYWYRQKLLPGRSPYQETAKAPFISWQMCLYIHLSYNYTVRYTSTWALILGEPVWRFHLVEKYFPALNIDLFHSKTELIYRFAGMINSMTSINRKKPWLWNQWISSNRITCIAVDRLLPNRAK